MDEELFSELEEVVEELDTGARISITRGAIGYDLSEELSNMIAEYLEARLEEEYGGTQDVL